MTPMKTLKSLVGTVQPVANGFAKVVVDDAPDYLKLHYFRPRQLGKAVPGDTVQIDYRYLGHGLYAWAVTDVLSPTSA